MTNEIDGLWPSRVAILGVGLLGGSVAMSIGRQRPETKFIGYARTPEKCSQLADLHLLDEVTDSIPTLCRGCDVIVVAAPVDRIAELVIQVSKHAPTGALITDVGSTKEGIVGQVSADSVAQSMFVAAHPIAGSEKSGARHAMAELFDRKTIVVTPTDQTDGDLLAKAEKFWGLTGGKTVRMSPAEHDAHLAAVSHVPHFVSALVAKMTMPGARPLVGSGWQDITRVAAGDPEMWTAICKENRAAIGQEFVKLRDELDRLLQMIEAKDDESLRSWLAEAKRVKEQTSNS
ncbi:MAG: prephenate dehydrogenase [Rubripirellula sp.]